MPELSAVIKAFVFVCNMVKGFRSRGPSRSEPPPNLHSSESSFLVHHLHHAQTSRPTSPQGFSQTAFQSSTLFSSSAPYPRSPSAVLGPSKLCDPLSALLFFESQPDRIFRSDE